LTAEWRPPDASDWRSSVQSDRALDQLVAATEHASGTPQRSERLRAAQVYAACSLRDEVQYLRLTLRALGDFAWGVLDELRGRDGTVVPLREREKGRR
jgi:hypothetical protein